MLAPANECPKLKKTDAKGGGRGGGKRGGGGGSRGGGKKPKSDDTEKGVLRAPDRAPVRKFLGAADRNHASRQRQDQPATPGHMRR